MENLEENAILREINARLQSLSEENMHLRAQLAELSSRTPTPMPMQNPVPTQPAYQMPSQVIQIAKYEKPSKYTGERDALMIDNWIFSVREYLAAYRVCGAEAVNVAASFTDGIAKQFWRMKKEEFSFSSPELLGDLECFFDLIRNRFFPSDFVQVLRDKLENLRQVKSVHEYASKFESLLLQMPRNSFSEGDMMDKFIRGLKREIRKNVLIADKQSLSEVIQCAERVDSVIYNIDSYRPKSNFTRSNFHDQMEVDYADFARSNGKPYKGYQNNSLGRENAREKSSSSGVQKSRCYNCQRLGHYSSNCPEPPTEETLARRRERSGKGRQQ